MLIHFTRSSAIIFTFYTNKTYDQSKKISSQTRFKKKKDMHELRESEIDRFF